MKINTLILLISLVFSNGCKSYLFNQSQAIYYQKEFKKSKKIKYDGNVIFLPKTASFLKDDLYYYLLKDTDSLDVTSNVYFISNEYKISDTVFIKQVILESGYSSIFKYKIGYSNKENTIDLTLDDNLQSKMYYLDFIEIIKPYCRKENLDEFTLLLRSSLNQNYRRFPVFSK